MLRYDSPFKSTVDGLRSKVNISIHEELNQLYAEKLDYEFSLKTFESLKESIEKKDIEHVLANRKYFEKDYPSLKMTFLILEKFQEAGWLSNSVIPEIIDRDFSDKIEDIQEKISNISVEISSCEEKIHKLESLLETLMENPSIDYIMGIAEGYQLLTDTDKKDIALYRLIENVVQESSRLKDEFVEKKEKEVEKESSSTASYTEEKKHVIHEKPEMEKIKTKSKDIYHKIQFKFSQLADRYRDVIEKYLSASANDFDSEVYDKISTILHQISVLYNNIVEKMNSDYFHLKREELEDLLGYLKDFQFYCSELAKLDMQIHQDSLENAIKTEKEELSEKDKNVGGKATFKILMDKYESIGTHYAELLDYYYHYLNDQPHYKTQILNDYTNLSKEKLDEMFHEDSELTELLLATKVFQEKEELEKVKDQVIAGNYMDIALIEVFEYGISEFLGELEELEQFYHKDDKDINVETVADDNNLYFLLDDFGNPIGVEEELIASLGDVSVERLINKSSVRDVTRFHDKVVLFKQAANNIVLSFIQVGKSEEEVPKLLVLAGESIKSDGISKITNKTNKILDRFDSLIDSQMALIRNGNSQYLELQEEVRKRVSSGTSEAKK